MLKVRIFSLSRINVMFLMNLPINFSILKILFSKNSFKKTFGSEIYNSWLQKISLEKEFNDYLILGVPTRFFRDWIVSRYLDKILEQVKTFKLSLTRIEFKIIEENKQKQEFLKIEELSKVTEIKDSLLNYNRLNTNLNFFTIYL